MLDVNVKIKLSQVSGSAGFGVPVILVSKAAKDIAYAEYTDIDLLPTAGFATDSEAYRMFQIQKMGSNPSAKIAVVQTTKKAAEALPALKGKVRQILTLLAETGDSTMLGVAEYVETTDSMTYFPVVKTAAELEQFEGLDRTFAGVHSDGQALAAGVLGACAGYDAGSFTYKNLIIKGVTPDDVTDGDVATIDNDNKTGKAYGYTIQRKAGDIVTTEGKNTAGEYMDIIDSFDFIIQEISYRSQKLLNSMPKVAFDNGGISSLEAVTNGVLAEADNMGIIAHDDAGTPLFSTDFGGRSDASDADRAARNYKEGKFHFELAGAIHTAAINGTAVV